MSNRIILSKRMLIPKEMIPKKVIDARYKVELFAEKACAKCDNMEFRPNELCKGCDAFVGAYKLYQETEKFWSVPQGDYLSLTALLDKKGYDYDIVEKRPVVKFKYPIKFTGSLFGEGHVDENGIKRINQKALLREWFEFEDGVLRARPRAGKCLVGNTIVNTSEGFLEFSEIGFAKGYNEYSTNIDGPFGNRKVTHSYKGKSKTIKLRTHNGFEIEGTPEHPVLVFTKNLQFFWTKLKDIREGDHIVSLSNKNKAIWPTTNEITKDEARLLGWMTANGRNSTFSSNDTEVVSKFKKVAEKLTGTPVREEKQHGKVTNYIMRQAKNLLEDLGYTAKNSSEKTIPEKVRRSSREVMRTFLSAYFECDSGLNKRDINLVSASETLIRQLQVILKQGFGINSSRYVINKSAANSNNPVVRPYWTLLISGSEAYKFVQEFPEAKVAKQFGHKFRPRNTPSPQESLGDYIPYLTGYLRNLYKKQAYSNNRRDRRIVSEKGDVLHNYGSPFNLRLYSSDRSLHTTRSTFIKTNWEQWINKLNILDSSLKNKLSKLVNNEFTFERVVHISVSKTEKTVYDVTVPQGHAFTANGLVSHNTVMATFASCRLKQKTIIMVDRKELAKQFYWAFMGNPRKKRPAMTNIPDLQKRTGAEIIRVAQKPKDLTNLEDVDILIVNYQKLVREPKRMAALVDGKFSFLIVDEVHGSGAEGYLRVVSACSVRHRMGLSATPRRKDNRHRLIHRIMGPVVAESNSASLIPTVNVRVSNVYPQKSYKQWHFAMSWLCGSKAANVELLKALFYDLRNGHDVLIVALDRKAHIDMLTKMVNQQARLNNKHKGEKWPEELAIKFYDGVDRDKVLDQVDRGGPTILFGMRSMIKQGIDFELPSKIHIFIPMSASNDRETGAPLFEQLSNRVATPARKPQPEIDIWFHRVGFFSRACVGLFWNEVWPNRITSQNPSGKYRVSKETFEKVKNINPNAKNPNQKSFDWAK